MKAKTTRYIDAAGRIVLPAHIRNQFNLTTGRCVEVEIEDGIIKLKPTDERCTICGKPVSDIAHITICDKFVCDQCAETIAQSYSVTSALGETV